MSRGRLTAVRHIIDAKSWAYEKSEEFKPTSTINKQLTHFDATDNVA